MSFLILFGLSGVRAVDLHGEADKEKNEIADSIIDRSYDSESDMPNKKNQFRILWGPKGGIGFFVPEKWTNTESHAGRSPGFGCAAGLTARFEWNSRWYVEPALMLAYGNSSVPVYFRRAEETPRYGGDYHMSRGAVQIPVHLGFKFRVVNDYHMSVFTGGMVSCGFAGSFEAPKGVNRFLALWRRRRMEKNELCRSVGIHIRERVAACVQSGVLYRHEPDGAQGHIRDAPGERVRHEGSDGI